MEENFSLYNGDCLDVLKTLEDNSIDSCVTDPPYGLSSVTPNNIEERIDKLFRKSFNVVFPDFNENDIGSFQYGKFFGVSIQSSDLSRFQIAPIIEPWIDMPKSSIDLDSNIEQGNKKIDTGTKSTTDIISDRILMDETNIMLGEFVGNYVFDFGDSVDFTRSDILCSFFSKYFPGKITVPISSIISPCLPDTLSDGNSFFGCKDLGYDIRSTNNSGSDAFSWGLILTRGGTKETPVLDFCFPTGSDGDIFSTVSTRDIGTFSQFLRPQIIRTFAATSSLSTSV